MEEEFKEIQSLRLKMKWDHKPRNADNFQKMEGQGN